MEELKSQMAFFAESLASTSTTGPIQGSGVVDGSGGLVVVAAVAVMEVIGRR